MFIIIVVNFILQSTILQSINILGIVPNTTLVIVVSIALLKGKRTGGIVGLLAGLLQDIIFSPTIGPNAFVYFFIGYLIGLSEQKVFKDSLFIPFIFTIITSLAYHGVYCVFMYFLGTNIRFHFFLRDSVLLETLYNSILIMPIYKWFSNIFTVPSIKFGRR
mgnify:CR=1 FL=1